MNKPVLFVVGLGPGDASLLTPQAETAIALAEIVVGYTLYIDLVPEELLAGKEIVSTGMMGEMERCAAAIEHARQGRTTAVVCSGDPGVYAMAGLVFELIEERGLENSFDVEIIPGVPAVCAAAALLGAPLMHDFACVSLSDLLTPWDVIERRAEAALAGDFVLALYNPRSRRRDWQLPRIIEAARRHRDNETPVGMVREAYRPGQEVRITPLAAFDPLTVDMLSLVIIGNSQSRIANGRMITPRGYMAKYR